MGDIKEAGYFLISPSFLIPKKNESPSLLWISRCNRGATGMKLNGNNGHNGQILPFLVHCVDAIDTILRCRQVD